jgi:hypothetical protein
LFLAGFYECDDEPSGIMKVGVFLDLLSDCGLPERDFATLMWFICLYIFVYIYIYCVCSSYFEDNWRIRFLYYEWNANSQLFLPIA